MSLEKPTFDSDGYPTDETLEVIRNWKEDWKALLEYVHEAWRWKDWGWSVEGRKYFISTGGWSGNEDIISAMEQNHLFQMF